MVGALLSGKWEDSPRSCLRPAVEDQLAHLGALLEGTQGLKFGAKK